jgi:type I restriction enzyme S subunit
MNRTLEEMAMALYKHWFVDSGYDQFSKYPLSEILKFVVDNRGKTAPTASEGIPLIATNCVKNESIFPSYDKVRYVDNDTYENWFRAHPKPGDILFVNKGTPGCVNLVPSPVDFCIAQDMIALRADESKVSNLYLFLYFRSKEVQFEIVNKSVGTTIPHLKKTDLLTFEVSIPEFEKMSALTQKVKHMFSQIETNVKENQTLTALRDTLLPKLISGEVRVKDAEQMVNEVL